MGKIFTNHVHLNVFAFSTVACPIGTFNNISRLINKQESSTCTPCSQGTYQDEEGQQSCKSCADGKTTSSRGAILSKDCDTDINAQTRGNSI